MNIKRITAAVLASAMINICGVTASAAVDAGRVIPKGARPAFGREYAGGFEELLATGIIMQSNQGKAKENFDKDPQSPSGCHKRWNTLERLLRDKIITPKEYGALKAAMAAPTKRAQAPDAANQANPFSRFVTDGLISGETSARIMDYLGDSQK